MSISFSSKALLLLVFLSPLREITQVLRMSNLSFWCMKDTYDCSSHYAWCWSHQLVPSALGPPPPEHEKMRGVNEPFSIWIMRALYWFFFSFWWCKYKRNIRNLGSPWSISPPEIKMYFLPLAKFSQNFSPPWTQGRNTVTFIAIRCHPYPCSRVALGIAMQ